LRSFGYGLQENREFSEEARPKHAPSRARLFAFFFGRFAVPLAGRVEFAPLWFLWLALAKERLQCKLCT